MLLFKLILGTFWHDLVSFWAANFFLYMLDSPCTFPAPNTTSHFPKEIPGPLIGWTVLKTTILALWQLLYHCKKWHLQASLQKYIRNYISPGQVKWLFTFYSDMIILFTIIRIYYVLNITVFILKSYRLIPWFKNFL